jgi:hypothetical protein
MKGPSGIDNILGQLNSKIPDGERFENFSNASDIDISNDNNIRNLNLKKKNNNSDSYGITLDI